MIWFESLLFYGFDEHSALKRGDVDNSLLPSIVEKVILSKLTGNHSSRVDTRMPTACRRPDSEHASLCELTSLPCVHSSFGRASVGPAVQQSDHAVRSFHSQTDEMLPDCAARGQQIHTGTF